MRLALWWLTKLRKVGWHTYSQPGLSLAEQAQNQAETSIGQALKRLSAHDIVQ